MGYNQKEKKWLMKYENRFVYHGLSRDEAIYIRNAVIDIDLEADPEACADREFSILESTR